jgi:hypothetical protein
MGKHETNYPRADRDYYPTPAWPVAALAEHVDLAGRNVWEPAAGSGSLARALVGLGATVFCSDVAEYGYPLDAIHDFTSVHDPVSVGRYDLTITNPPFGERGKLAEAFIAAGLRRIVGGGSLCLLLPIDFVSAISRRRFFCNCPLFVAKIVLVRRIVWFERSDGIRAAPKENSAWFIWQHSALRTRLPPLTLYAPPLEPLA